MIMVLELGFFSAIFGLLTIAGRYVTNEISPIAFWVFVTAVTIAFDHVWWTRMFRLTGTGTEILEPIDDERQIMWTGEALTMGLISVVVVEWLSGCPSGTIFSTLFGIDLAMTYFAPFLFVTALVVSINAWKEVRRWIEIYSITY